MTNVELPKANENLVEATLDRWLVKEGDTVAKDQGLCVIITDKATVDMPAPVAGTVLKILAPGRAVLPVGYIMCVLGVPGEPVPADLEARNEAVVAAHRSATTALAPPGAHERDVRGTTGVSPVGVGGVRATPAARRLAKEAGVDLAVIAGALRVAGPLTEKDVKTYLEKG
ncbi:MAG: E3 binding domain-containing protein [Planctomycetota bacterium]|nr:E3 binding domain-containing protein [Planctomycetota bacterium]